MRLTAQALTDLYISNRQVFMIQGGLQLGLPIRAFEKRVDAPPLPKTSSQPLKPETMVTFGPEFIYFDFNSAKLSEKSKKMLQRLGDFLSKSNAWENLEIGGHTDTVGSFDYNLKLSDARALSVKSAILSGGFIKNTRIKAKGHSFSQPLSKEMTPEAQKLNRRVEFGFDKVKNPKDFERALEEIRQSQNGG